MLEKEQIKSIFKNNAVYIDESVLTSYCFIDFINENYQWLKENNFKFHIHKGIKDALIYSPRFMKVKNIGFATIEVLQEKGMIEYFGEEEIYEPVKYIEHFVMNYLTENIVMFSNNPNFSKDIITINHFSALSNLRQITVFRVNKCGEIGYFNNKTGMESNNYEGIKERVAV